MQEFAPAMDSKLKQCLQIGRCPQRVPGRGRIDTLDQSREDSPAFAIDVSPDATLGHFPRRLMLHIMLSLFDFQ
jgi:hypothetical protein